MKLNDVLPVSPGLDRVDSAYADSNFIGNSGLGDPDLQKKSDGSDASFVDDGATVVFASLRSMPYGIKDIFVFGSIAKVAGTVVVPVAINVSDDASGRSGAYESLRHKLVDVCRRLGLFSFPLLERDGKVVRGCVGFADKTLSVFHDGDAPKVAHLVNPFKAWDRFPNLMGVRHA